MNFEHTAKVKDLIARVSDLMDRCLSGRGDLQRRDGGRPQGRQSWIVVKVLEELKEKTGPRACGTFSLPESHLGGGLTISNTPARRDHIASVSPPRSSTARPPTPATWKSSSATAPTG